MINSQTPHHYSPTIDKPHSMATESEQFKDHVPTLYNKYKGSRQRIYRFENMYGASVIIGPFSYLGEKGWLELAVLKFTDPEDQQGSLCYDTPITNDVMFVETEEELQHILDQIAGLE